MMIRKPKVTYEDSLAFTYDYTTPGLYIVELFAYNVSTYEVNGRILVKDEWKSNGADNFLPTL